MALQIERQLAIQELIKAQQTVKVDELAATFQVSPNTIRRDLSALEEQGILKRTQGGAVFYDALPSTQQSFDVRLRRKPGEKERIGKFAATLVKSGSTIILDAGTTTQQLARHLSLIERLTVATNSLEVARILGPSSNVTVILSGGIILGNSRSLIGPPAEQFFSRIHADQLFLAARGISEENGLTNQNMLETAVKQKMIEAAKEVILLADYEKFGKTALSPFAPLHLIHKTITDKKPPEDMEAHLASLGIEIIVAD